MNKKKEKIELYDNDSHDYYKLLNTEEKLIIHYGSTEITNGELINTSYLQLKPTKIYYKPSDPNKFYALFLVDVDAPSKDNPTNKLWRHWGIINIKWNKDYESINYEEVTKYEPPNPPKGTGRHRYVFVLFEQTEKIIHNNNNNNLKLNEQRSTWNLLDFIKNNKTIGNIINILYFESESE